MEYRKLVEWLANKEHEQWVSWSHTLAIAEQKNLSKERLKRWSKLWKSYKKLTQEQKEQDREWALKIIDEVPFKCPIHQCGGLMESIVRKKPKEVDADIDGYNGDEQTPDLVCTNCKAIYQFSKFKGGLNSSQP